MLHTTYHSTSNFAHTSASTGSRLSRLAQRFSDWREDADTRPIHIVIDLMGMAIVVGVLWWAVAAVS